MPKLTRLPAELGFRPRMFADRRTAGRQLAQALIHHAGTQPIVYALGRVAVQRADHVDVASAHGHERPDLVLAVFEAP
ncbi:MAG TPA: hypothetical protein VFS15_21805 [Kofleriaceae bacterium]|nr:hypothetical protein [Kofleriaceae bacterium]